MPSMMYTKVYKLQACVQPSHAAYGLPSGKDQATGKGDSRSPQMPVVTADQPSVTHQIGGQDPKLPLD